MSKVLKHISNLVSFISLGLILVTLFIFFLALDCIWRGGRIFVIDVGNAVIVTTQNAIGDSYAIN